MSTASMLKADGIADFSGGMDSYVSPSFLAENQYRLSVNCKVKTGLAGISVRDGFREINLRFTNDKQERLYRESENIQGCGSFFHQGVLNHVVSCDGNIFHMKQTSKFDFDVTLAPFKNNPNRDEFFLTRVPRGAMCNDGQSQPIYFKDGGVERVKYTSKNITAGRAGVFIQGRYFYISEDGMYIIPGTINTPDSLEENILNNVIGYRSPDNSRIIAIGKQKIVNSDADGGSLVFSTENNIYFIDVRGPMSSWGVSEYGRVVADIYDVSATSPYTMCNMNGNLFFRSRRLGLVSLQYLSYIFNNSDITEPQSYGGHTIFENDDEYLLNKVYTAKLGNSIYTTVGPEIIGSRVFWNGLLVATPAERGTIRYESVHTGVRPWCIDSIQGTHSSEFLFIHSHDHDGANRMYVIDNSINYDLRANGKISEIEAKIHTRFFNFKNPFASKKENQNIVSIEGVERDLSICVFSRNNQNKSYKPTFSTKVSANRGVVDNRGFFLNRTLESESIDISFSTKQEMFFEKQDLFVMKGPFRLTRILKEAILSSPEKIVSKDKIAKLRDTYDTTPEKVYSYKFKD